MPTPEEFPQGKQIKFLLENLLPGKLLVEQALVSTKHRYAGRVDFVGEYEGHTTVFDWTTTSRTYVEKSYYADKLTQAAAYAIAIEEQYGFHVDTVAVVVMGPRKAVMFKDPAAQWKTAWLQRLEAFKLQELPF